jgi:RNA polymerase sigma-70 factor (ECF subfamily)
MLHPAGGRSRISLMWLLWAVWGAVGSVPDQGDDVDDRSALSRIAHGDHAGLADLYDRYARPVYSLAFRILKSQSEAEDTVQDVFSQAWRQASRYDLSRGRVAAWLLMLTRSRAIDRLRALRVRKVEATEDHGIDLDRLVDEAPRPDLQAISADQRTRIRSAFEQLPATQRTALELAYYEGLTHSEIAAQLEEPLGTVKARIRAGLGRLRDLLSAEAL